MYPIPSQSVFRLTLSSAYRPRTRSSLHCSTAFLGLHYRAATTLQPMPSAVSVRASSIVHCTHRSCPCSMLRGPAAMGTGFSYPAPVPLGVHNYSEDSRCYQPAINSPCVSGTSVISRQHSQVTAACCVPSSSAISVPSLCANLVSIYTHACALSLCSVPYIQCAT